MPSKTLLLAPPSIAAHPSALQQIAAAHDRSSTDIQMLDRLAMGLVFLPGATYDLILLLTDADGSRSESQHILDRNVMTRVVQALRPGGRLRSQDGSYPSGNPEKTEAILAGLISQDNDGMVKPESTSAASVPLRFGRKADAGPKTLDTTPPFTTNGKRKSTDAGPTVPLGVGFSDDLDDLDDDELIDEDTLLTEEDMARPVVPRKSYYKYTAYSALLTLIVAPECQPKAGKRRRACKDCTCGLAQKLEAEDRAKRVAADRALTSMNGISGGDSTATTNNTSAKLGANDLSEIDFTVPGKVGSCGNCALGDAFRCDGCPYIGLPAFKPGEQVMLMDNDIQL